MEEAKRLQDQIYGLKGFEPLNPPKLIESIEEYRPKLQEHDTNPAETRPVMVIDNGSYNCRAGWNFEEKPYLNFRSQVTKPKSLNREFSYKDFLVGDECDLFETGKIQKKTPFDKNVVYNINNQEAIFDHVFSHLGVSGESVNYPILLTEAFWNPNYSRAMVSELLFEKYGAPYLTLSVDFLLSFYYNQVKRFEGQPVPLSGLWISSSHNVTHLVPIIDGVVNISNSKRISLGGSHNNELLGKSLNLRYPGHKNKLTPPVIQEIQERHTACADNYSEQLRFFETEYEKESARLKEEETINRKMMLEGGTKESNTLKEITKKGSHLKIYRNAVDFSNSEDSSNIHPDRLIQLDWSPIEQPSEEEEKRKEAMRKEQGKRLRDINAKKRDEKQKKLTKELSQIEIHENDRSLEEDKPKLKELGFKSMEELLERIEYIREKLGITPKEEKKEEEKWPLLIIDDSQLDEEQKKLKRIQKMQKSSYLKRMEKRLKDDAERKRIEKMKTDNPEKYLKSLYAWRKSIYHRMEDRKEKKEQMSKRDGFKRKMKTIAKIGAINDDTKNKKNNESEEDDFGINDDDWQVYKTIAKPGYEEDDQEEDIQALEEINEKIAEVNPNFSCLYGDNDHKQIGPEDFQLRLGTDRFRGSEILFQPSIMGNEFAGITEILENIFHNNDNKMNDILTNFILLTGANTKIEGMDRRIRSEIQMMRPQGSPLNIIKAYDPSLDAWNGGLMFARREDFLEQTSISKAQYEEWGPFYLKQHFASNLWYGEALNIRTSGPMLKKRVKTEE